MTTTATYKKILAISMVLLGFTFFHASAQQLPIYTSYVLNQVALNPATAGASGFSGVNLGTRADWIGFKGSPTTFTLAGEHRMSKQSSPWGSAAAGGLRGNIGVGLVIFSDHNGPMVKTGFKGIYAYHIRMPEFQLSFGLGISGNQTKVDMQQIDLIEQDDPLALNIAGNSSSFSPDASFGVYLNSYKFFVGLSADQLMQNAIRFGEKTVGLQMIRHYYFTGGYSFDISRDFYIEPSLLLKFNEIPAFQSDITVKAVYKNLYWGGLNYRTNNDFTFLFGVRVMDFYIGYSYDFNSSALFNYSFNSHEINLGYRLRMSDDRKRIRERY